MQKVENFILNFAFCNTHDVLLLLAESYYLSFSEGANECLVEAQTHFTSNNNIAFLLFSMLQLRAIELELEERIPLRAKVVLHELQ